MRFSRSVWERFLSSLSKQSRFPIFSASFRWTIEASQRVDNMHTGGPCQAVRTGIVRGVHTKNSVSVEFDGVSGLGRRSGRNRTLARFAER